jgi:hypothetical protein
MVKILSGDPDKLQLHVTVVPHSGDVKIRVSPGHAEQLGDDLASHGLHASRVIELSAGSDLAILAIGGGAGAGGLAAIVRALAPVISAWIDRNKPKKVSFGENGSITSIEGMSAREIERLLRRQAQLPDDDAD